MRYSQLLNMDQIEQISLAKTFYYLFCYYCTEETFFSHSWHRSVQILELIPNDEKSMWLVGRESGGDVQIGFIVSFSSLLNVCWYFDCP